MSDAVRLFFGLPNWFFSNLLEPFEAGPLSLVPFVGILCLIVGAGLGAWMRATYLWRFVLPIVASQILVAVAGFLRGGLDTSVAGPMLASFMAVILGWSLFLVYKAKGARIPALFLAVFTLSYAAFTSFIAWMSFADTWT